MYTPELIDPQTPDDMPLLVRRIFFVSALASVGLAILAYFFVAPGLDELLGRKADDWGALDRAISIYAGVPAAFCGLFAAWQGWDGKPKLLSRIIAGLGFILNIAVLVVMGLPFLLDYLKTV